MKLHMWQRDQNPTAPHWRRALNYHFSKITIRMVPQPLAKDNRERGHQEARVLA